MARDSLVNSIGAPDLFSTIDTVLKYINSLDDDAEFLLDLTNCLRMILLAKRF